MLAGDDHCIFFLQPAVATLFLCAFVGTTIVGVEDALIDEI
jgi:hypothetical protein